jgi:hypothetical protein
MEHAGGIFQVVEQAFDSGHAVNTPAAVFYFIDYGGCFNSLGLLSS